MKFAALLALLVLVVPHGEAQPYPTRPVKIVVAGDAGRRDRSHRAARSRTS
jgi:tripartite-type tricarboxylate transporter receptor subunit TctC